MADSLPGPLDEPTLGMLQSLPDLPTMSDSIKFRVGDRMIWLVAELASTAVSDATEPT